MLGSLLLIGQLLYFLRAETIALFPQTRPWMQKFCQVMACQLKLPQHSGAVQIEQDSLEQDTSQPMLYHLYVTLNNQSALRQAYPKLSLTLNGRHGMVVARRYIAPKEYLPANMSEAAGINAGAMLEVELVLATAGEPARSYKLHLVP